MKVKIIKGKSISKSAQRGKEFKAKKSKGKEIKLAEEKSKQEKEGPRGKRKGVPTQATTACQGNVCIAPVTPNLDTRRT